MLSDRSTLTVTGSIEAATTSFRVADNAVLTAKRATIASLSISDVASFKVIA
jgi:hypothetical protein